LATLLQENVLIQLARVPYAAVHSVEDTDGTNGASDEGPTAGSAAHALLCAAVSTRNGSALWTSEKEQASASQQQMLMRGVLTNSVASDSTRKMGRNVQGLWHPKKPLLGVPWHGATRLIDIQWTCTL
jgi:hypothetical protein